MLTCACRVLHYVEAREVPMRVLGEIRTKPLMRNGRIQGLIAAAQAIALAVLISVMLPAKAFEEPVDASRSNPK
jgi:hypothetical protein